MVKLVIFVFCIIVLWYVVSYYATSFLMKKTPGDGGSSDPIVCHLPSAILGSIIATAVVAELIAILYFTGFLEIIGVVF